MYLITHELRLFSIGSIQPHFHQIKSAVPYDGFQITAVRCFLYLVSDRLTVTCIGHELQCRGHKAFTEKSRNIVLKIFGTFNTLLAKPEHGTFPHIRRSFP